MCSANHSANSKATIVGIYGTGLSYMSYFLSSVFSILYTYTSFKFSHLLQASSSCLKDKSGIVVGQTATAGCH